MSNPFSLEGKVALVTGANTGLGQGVAVALAAAGADIAGAGIVPASGAGGASPLCSCGVAVIVWVATGLTLLAGLAPPSSLDSRSVAAPITVPRGSFSGAIQVAGTLETLPPERLPSVAAAVRNAAAALTDRL